MCVEGETRGIFIIQRLLRAKGKAYDLFRSPLLNENTIMFFLNSIVTIAIERLVLCRFVLCDSCDNE